MKELQDGGMPMDHHNGKTSSRTDKSDSVPFEEVIDTMPVNSSNMLMTAKARITARSELPVNRHAITVTLILPVIRPLSGGDRTK